MFIHYGRGGSSAAAWWRHITFRKRSEEEVLGIEALNPSKLINWHLEFERGGVML